MNDQEQTPEIVVPIVKDSDRKTGGIRSNVAYALAALKKALDEVYDTSKNTSRGAFKPRYRLNSGFKQNQRKALKARSKNNARRLGHV